MYTLKYENKLAGGQVDGFRNSNPDCHNLISLDKQNKEDH